MCWWKILLSVSLTLKLTGPDCDRIVPDNHLSPTLLKFLTNTLSRLCSCQTWAWLSWFTSCLNWIAVTCWLTSLSSLVRIFWPSSNLAGDIVVCGVLRYWNKNHAILSETVPLLNFRSACLKILTARWLTHWKKGGKVLFWHGGYHCGCKTDCTYLM